MGLIGQVVPELRCIEWLFCSHTPSKTLSPYLALVCSLILGGRQRCTKLAGHDRDINCLPLTKTQFETLLTSTDWQMARADWLGQVEHSLPQRRHHIFLSHTTFLCPTRIERIPSPGALTVLTDGSGKAGKQPSIAQLMVPFNRDVLLF